MTRTALALLFLLVSGGNFCGAQSEAASAPQPAQGQQAPSPPPEAQQPPAPGSSQPSNADFKYFFTASGAAFEAYMDQKNIKVDPDGNKLVTIKLTKFSAAFRDWIKSNFPGGETADYAIDSYSIDCEAKKVGEHEITWYEASGTELANYDFGGIMNTPIVYSMKDNLMKKLCGLP